MGIIDTIKELFQTKDKGPSPKEFINDVRKAAQSSDYNKATSKAFVALENFGAIYGGIKREIHVTAREYSKLLVETGTITEEELYPIIHNFEIATYSDADVTFEDFEEVEKALGNANMKLKNIGKEPKGPKGRTSARRRTSGRKTKRKSSGKGTRPAAARRRKARRKV